MPAVHSSSPICSINPFISRTNAANSRRSANQSAPARKGPAVHSSSPICSINPFISRHGLDKAKMDRVQLRGCPSLWSAISSISALAGRVSGAGLCWRFSNFRFGVVGGPGVGIERNRRNNPPAKQLAHAPEPALPSPDEGRDALPIARDDERALSDARRNVTGRSEE